MEWGDRLGPGCNGGLDFFWIHVISRTIAIDEHRPRANRAHGECGGNIRVGGQNDFVPWSNIQSHQGEPQRVEPTADPHSVAHTCELCELLLELSDLFAQDEIAIGEHFLHGGLEISCD